jgi:hypothetical protein
MYRTHKGITSSTEAVFETIKNHPGISTQDIQDLLFPRFNSERVKRTLTYLRDSRHEIENRGGGTGHPTEWYVVDRKDPFHILACQIIEDMQSMSTGMRRAYLAEQLETVSRGES